MTEYLAPGTYVEEISRGTRPIEPVGTSTAGFVGLTGRGPIGRVPTLLTSIAQFESIYGGASDLEIGGVAATNCLAHAVRAFFDNGGSRLYVARVAGVGATAATVSAGGVTLEARAPGGGTLAGTSVNVRVEFAIDSVATTKAVAVRQQPGTLVQVGIELVVIGGDDTSALDQLTDDAGVTIPSLAATVTAPEGVCLRYSGLGFDAAHPRYVADILGPTPPHETDALTNRVVLSVAPEIDARVLYATVVAQPTFDLVGGSDGVGPPSQADWQAGIDALVASDDLSLLAAPGASSFPAPTPSNVSRALIAATETPGAYRFAVLDPPPGLTPADVRTFKASFDSRSAALYYPWITVAGTIPIAVPPSGFLCGLYAKTDAQSGVWKAPADTVVTGAIGLQHAVSLREQNDLNPRGINCIRSFPDRGIRVWGARTLSSDTEWTYVNVRRYFLYLEQSIARGTQWTVFEPNGEPLWARVRASIGDFLYSEWRHGAILGAKPAQAYFVRCDRTTMTQDDLDNGRLVCLIGIAPINPAEFVIFRIGQWTADAKMVC